MMGARDGDGSAGCSHHPEARVAATPGPLFPFLTVAWLAPRQCFPGAGSGGTCGCLGSYTVAFLLQSGEQLCPLLPFCHAFYRTGSGPASLCPMGLPLCCTYTIKILSCRGVGGVATRAREVSVQAGVFATMAVSKVHRSLGADLTSKPREAESITLDAQQPGCLAPTSSTPCVCPVNSSSFRPSCCLSWGLNSQPCTQQHCAAEPYLHTWPSLMFTVLF